MNEALKKKIIETLDFQVEASIIGRSFGKGCAILGKTEIDVLEFVKNFLLGKGVVEYATKTKEGDLIIVDCKHQKKGLYFVSKLVEKYKNVPFVILNNCENLFTDENLILFKHIGDDWRDHNSCPGMYSNIQSYFIFIVDKNPLPEVYEKSYLKRKKLYPDEVTWEGAVEPVEAHISVFYQLYDVFDIEKGRQHLPATNQLLDNYDDEWSQILEEEK